MGYVLWTLRIVLLLAVGATLHYSLPSRDVVYLLGTEVAQVQVTERDANGNEVTRGRDVRYIKAAYPDGSPRVYRNEDTDWSFPWYLKFDSANLDTLISSMVTTPPQDPIWVVVTHYGWRVPVLSWFPNAIAVRPATGPDEPLTPWFNIVLVGALALGYLVLRRLVMMAFRAHVDPVISGTADAMGRSARGWRAWAGRVF